MGWLTGSEIYPVAVREADTSVQSALLWSTNLLITLTLPSMIEGIGVGPRCGSTRRSTSSHSSSSCSACPNSPPQPRAAEGALLKGHFRPDDFVQHTAKLAA